MTELTEIKAQSKSLRTKNKISRFFSTQWMWWAMLLPGILLTLVFKYGSMFGLVMAFQDFNPYKGTFFGQEWASNGGFGNLIYVFELEKFWNSVWNTLVISGAKIVLGIAVPLFLAILINEIKVKFFSRTVQTTFFLPFFLFLIPPKQNPKKRTEKSLKTRKNRTLILESDFLFVVFLIQAR